MPLPASALPPPLLATDSRRRRSLISLTPLIDVVFILLVFFMLTSSFLNWRAIELNAPGRTAAGITTQDTLLIEIRQDGLRLDGESLGLPALSEQVIARLEQTPDQRIQIRPAPGVALQRAVEVLDRLSAAGAGNLSLIRAAQK